MDQLGTEAYDSRHIDTSLIRKRRRILAAAALLIVAAVVAAVLLLRGGSDGDGDKRPQPSVLQRGALAPVKGKKAGGFIEIVDQSGKLQLRVLGTGLEPTATLNAYEVWLYNDRKDAFSLGRALTDPKGTLVGQSTLRREIANRYSFIDISLESRKDDNKHSGRSVLRAQLGALPPE